MLEEIHFKLTLLHCEKFRLLALLKFCWVELWIDFKLKTSFQKMYTFAPPPQTCSFWAVAVCSGGCRDNLNLTLPSSLKGRPIAFSSWRQLTVVCIDCPEVLRVPCFPGVFCRKWACTFWISSVRIGLHCRIYPTDSSLFKIAHFEEFKAIRCESASADSHVAGDRTEAKVVYKEPPFVIDDYFYYCFH